MPAVEWRGGQDWSPQYNVCMYMCSVTQSWQTLCESMDCIACQAPLSVEFSRQEYWSRLPCPPPGDFPDPGIDPHLLYLLHCMRILNSWAIMETHVCILFQMQMRDNGGFLNKAALWYPVSMDSFLHLYVTLPARSNPKGIKCLCVGKAKCKFKGSVQLSRVRLFATPWIAARQASLSIPNSRSSLKLTSIESVMSRPSSWWCHPAISSSFIPFSSCSQSLPASESFPMSQLFAWSGQSTGVSALLIFIPTQTDILLLG